MVLGGGGDGGGGGGGVGGAGARGGDGGGGGGGEEEEEEEDGGGVAGGGAGGRGRGGVGGGRAERGHQVHRLAAVLRKEKGGKVQSYCSQKWRQHGGKHSPGSCGESGGQLLERSARGRGVEQRGKEFSSF